MSRRFRIGFLQGLADSDGYVHLQDQEVHLIVSPNKINVAGLLRSLHVPFSSCVRKGLDVLRLKVKEAALIPIFSPHVGSYRFKLGGSACFGGENAKWTLAKKSEIVRREVGQRGALDKRNPSECAGETQSCNPRPERKET